MFNCLIYLVNKNIRILISIRKSSDDWLFNTSVLLPLLRRKGALRPLFSTQLGHLPDPYFWDLLKSLTTVIRYIVQRRWHETRIGRVAQCFMTETTTHGYVLDDRIAITLAPGGSFYMRFLICGVTRFQFKSFGLSTQARKILTLGMRKNIEKNLGKFPICYTSHRVPSNKNPDKIHVNWIIFF